MAREWGGRRGRVLERPYWRLPENAGRRKRAALSMRAGWVGCEIVRIRRDDLRLRGERTPDAPSPYSARPAPAGLLTGSPQFLRRCGC